MTTRTRARGSKLRWPVVLHGRCTRLAGFWSSETLKQQLPILVVPYESQRVVHCSYELSMGNEAWVTSHSDGGTRIKITLRKDERVHIPPGQFALLLVKERIEIPSHAIGLISMKSKLKMRGLINVSGFHVDPGYRGKLVFGVFNAGADPITIKQGEATFLLWYVSLDQSTDASYAGSRQGLEHITDDQVMNLTGLTYNPTAIAEKVSSLANRISYLEDRRARWVNLRGRLIVGVVSAVFGAAFGVGLTLLIQALT